MEYNEKGIFEDRATQTVINRDFDVPEFKVTRRNGTVKILTDAMEITYHGSWRSVFKKQLISKVYM